LLFRAGGQGVYINPITFALCGIVIGSIILGRLITDTAQRTAEENAQHAEHQKQIAEEQARELAEANELMSTQLDQQKELLDLVATLETPAVPLAEGVLFAPIIGHIDSRRAQALTTRLLHEASTQRARLVVLDITGVTIVDTAVAKALLNTTRALQLLGCQVTVSGISASVAITLTQLGVHLQDVATARNPQEALAQHIGGAIALPSDR
jgi:rsbT co-antagonist protein RsbR